MGNNFLIDSLREFQAAFRESQRVVLEVHEGVVTDLPGMRRLREQLNGLGMGLAYDDFGAGQSRLTELAEVPPDFIKLDMSLIRGIDAAVARQDLVLALTRVMADLGIRIIAEGIETAEEAKTCLDLGCNFGQGFLFGHPQTPDLLGADQEVKAVQV
jgi:EAL domain-containing protein (putative c-di-GMP-specific phosphodiesterase class I)